MKNFAGDINNAQLITVLAPSALASGQMFVPTGGGRVLAALDAAESGASVVAVLSGGPITGVPATDHASTQAWAAGELLDWDVSAFKFVKQGAAATGDIVGAAVAAAAKVSTATTGSVILTGTGSVSA